MVDSLKKYELNPGIDIGLSHISEAISAYKQMLNDGSVEINGEKLVSDIMDIMVEIADRRAIIQKGMERLNLLVSLKKDNNNSYGEVIGFLRKGAFNLSDEEIDQLIKDKNNLNNDEEGWRNSLLEKVQQFSEKQAEKEKEKVEGRGRIIKSVADAPFFKKDGPHKSIV